MGFFWHCSLTETDYILKKNSQKVKFMSCVICGAPAVRVDAGSKYEERTCPECGHYRVTDKALFLMKAHGWHFDVHLTQRWIAEQGLGVIPIIDSHQAGRLIDV